MRKLYFLILLSFLLGAPLLHAQDSTKSDAYRNTPTEPEYPLVKPTRGKSYQLLSGFDVMERADKGDPMAQHELGLRYLLGRGFNPDTAKALYWIKKAADNKLPSARFNLGIMKLNEVGIAWDPFSAFGLFRDAAEHGMREAQFIYGLFFTENLVVNKDMNTAYKWIKRSARANYEPAEEVLKEMVKNNMIVPVEGETEPDYPSAAGDTSSGTLAYSDMAPDYYEFVPDTAEDPGSPVREVFAKDTAEVKKILGIEKDTDPVLRDSSTQYLVEFAARNGSPEALLILGKAYETGTGFEKDLVEAASCYIRAQRVGSAKAGAMLYQLVLDPDFETTLKKQAKRDDTDAMFVWAGLSALGYLQGMPQQEAIDLLNRAVDKGHVLSMIELGLSYYSGTIVKKDREKAVEYLQKAADAGSREAAVRLAFLRVSDKENEKIPEAVSFLKKAADEGSVLAQTALGYCYENGIGVKQNKGTATAFYRKAAYRGNETAYNSLKRLYDEIRPEDKEIFQVYTGS